MSLSCFTVCTNKEIIKMNTNCYLLTKHNSQPQPSAWASACDVTTHCSWPAIFRRPCADSTEATGSLLHRGNGDIRPSTHQGYGSRVQFAPVLFGHKNIRSSKCFTSNFGRRQLGIRCLVNIAVTH